MDDVSEESASEPVEEPSAADEETEPEETEPETQAPQTGYATVKMPVDAPSAEGTIVIEVIYADGSVNTVYSGSYSQQGSGRPGNRFGLDFCWWRNTGSRSQCNGRLR